MDDIRLPRKYGSRCFLMREGAIANGQPLLPKVARSFRFEEAATDLENNYKIEGRRSLDELRFCNSFFASVLTLVPCFQRWARPSR